MKSFLLLTYSCANQRKAVFCWPNSEQNNKNLPFLDPASFQLPKDAFFDPILAGQWKPPFSDPYSVQANEKPRRAVFCWPSSELANEKLPFSIPFNLACAGQWSVSFYRSDLICAGQWKASLWWPNSVQANKKLPFGDLILCRPLKSILLLTHFWTD